MYSVFLGKFHWKADEESINLWVLLVKESMQASREIRKKLATLIGHLISRCISEARMIPTVLHREEVINILVDDPALFVKLVKDEDDHQDKHSKEDLTVKMDAVSELGRLDSLEAFEKSFWSEKEIALEISVCPLLEFKYAPSLLFVTKPVSIKTLGIAV